MSDAMWIKQENRIKEIETFSISAIKALENNWREDSYLVNVEKDDIDIEFDLSELFSPILGNFWKVLYNERDYDGIRDTMSHYWKYKKIPLIRASLISFENSDEKQVFHVKLVNENKKPQKIEDLNSIIKSVNESFDYNRVVIGSNSDHLEFQFLNSASRIEVKKDDFVDPGVFVFANGKIQIAAGINRLVCTNGLTERIWAFKSDRLNSEILQRSINLANWLAERVHDKVCSINELAVLLNNYPESMRKKFWKVWSQKIENDELSWFDVIDDITRYANLYLNKTRQNLLQFSEVLKSYCPTCNTKVK